MCVCVCVCDCACVRACAYVYIHRYVIFNKRFEQNHSKYFGRYFALIKDSNMI